MTVFSDANGYVQVLNSLSAVDRSEFNLNKNRLYYLYCPADTIQDLKNGHLPLSTDLTLFEPCIHAVKNRSRMNSEERLEKRLKREYQRLPENIRALLSFDDFRAQKDQLFASEAAVSSEDASEGVAVYGQSGLDRLAYLRLMSSPLSHYGWRELADNFSGICLGLNPAAAMFQSSTDQPVKLAAVQYGAEHRPQPGPDNPIPGFFMDHPDYRFLAEWRAAYVLAKQKNSSVKVGRATVAEAYISSTADEPLRHQFSQLFGKDMRYRTTSQFEVLPDSDCWQLKAKPIA